MTTTLEQITAGDLTPESAKEQGLRPLEPHEIVGDGAREVIASVKKQSKRIVGPRLQALRHARKWDLQKAAQRFGVNKSTLQRWEVKDELAANHPILEPIARVFEIKVEDLTEGSEEPLLNPRALAMVHTRTGKKFPGQGNTKGTAGRKPINPRDPKYKQRHENYEHTKLVLGKPHAVTLGKIPNVTLRAIATTFNANRMKGLSSIDLPMDVCQVLLGAVLVSKKVDPTQVLITADYADIFSKIRE